MPLNAFFVSLFPHLFPTCSANLLFKYAIGTNTKIPYSLNKTKCAGIMIQEHSEEENLTSCSFFLSCQ